MILLRFAVDAARVINAETGGIIRNGVRLRWITGTGSIRRHFKLFFVAVLVVLTKRAITKILPFRLAMVAPYILFPGGLASATFGRPPPSFVFPAFSECEV